MKAASILCKQASSFYNGPHFGRACVALSLASVFLSRKVNHIRKEQTDAVLQRLGNVQSIPANNYRLNVDSANIWGLAMQACAVSSVFETAGLLMLESGFQSKMASDMLNFKATPQSISSIKDALRVTKGCQLVFGPVQTAGLAIGSYISNKMVENIPLQARDHAQ